MAPWEIPRAPCKLISLFLQIFCSSQVKKHVSPTHLTVSAGAVPFSPCSSLYATSKIFSPIDCGSLEGKQWSGFYVNVNSLLSMLSTTRGLFSKIKFSFENIARLAQSVKHGTLNLRVVGSSPRWASLFSLLIRPLMSINSCFISIKQKWSLIALEYTKQKIFFQLPSTLAVCVRQQLWNCLAHIAFPSYFWCKTFSLK